MPSRAERGSGERGFALLITLLLMTTIGVGMFLGAQRSADEREAERAQADARALTAARDALVAYALAGGTGTPGALPCPDMDGDGDANNFDCQASGPEVWLGRLPTSTLGISPKHGAADERLWYVLDDDFLDLNTKVNPGSEPSLRIADDPAVYAALLIVAGDPVAGQEGRPSDDPGDYLEGENDIGGPASTSEARFASCAANECNDRVVGITAGALLELVQPRVFAELEHPLAAFLGAQGHLPYAQAFDGSCQPPSDLEGLLPVAAECSVGERLDADDFPSWIPDNDWHDHIVYRVDASCAGAPPCSAGDLQMVTEDGVEGGLTVVLGVAGVPLPGQDRAAAPTAADFLEGDENGDGDERYHDGHGLDDGNDLFGWR